MKTKLLLSFLTLNLYLSCFGQVHTTYLWHLHQPTYWGDKSKINPNRSKLQKESQELKFSGGNMYSARYQGFLTDELSVAATVGRVADPGLCRPAAQCWRRAGNQPATRSAGLAAVAGGTA